MVVAAAPALEALREALAAWAGSEEEEAAAALEHLSADWAVTGALVAVAVAVHPPEAVGTPVAVAAPLEGMGGPEDSSVRTLPVAVVVAVLVWEELSSRDWDRLNCVNAHSTPITLWVAAVGKPLTVPWAARMARAKAGRCLSMQV